MTTTTQESVEHIKGRLGLVEPTLLAERRRHSGGPAWLSQKNTKGWTIPVLVRYAPRTMEKLWGRGDVATALKRAHLGTGTFAEAFALPDGRVLKVSTDPDDVIVSYHIMGHAFDGIVLTELVARIDTLSQRDFEALMPLAQRRVSIGIHQRLPLERDSFHLMIVERVIALDDMVGMVRNAKAGEQRDLLVANIDALKAALASVSRVATMVKPYDDDEPISPTRIDDIYRGLREAAKGHAVGSSNRDVSFATRPVLESKSPRLAAVFAENLIEGYATIVSMGGALTDLHEGNVGLSPRDGGMAVILDLGYKSAGSMPEPVLRRVNCGSGRGRPPLAR